MTHRFYLKILAFTVLTVYSSTCAFFLPQTEGKGVKTSYKRYSIFKYKNDDVLCEPYTVSKDDWLYKIFRKKGEISEKDFPHFLIIFKEINPQINNIDAIEPGINILIPLKKIEKEDYDQSTPGTVDVPVIEFSTMSENFDFTPFFKEYKIQKGQNVSSLIDKEFLQKGGLLSEEGLKIFKLANPNIKNVNIVYEGTDVYLPNPSIKSQPWFQSFLSGKTNFKDTVQKNPDEKQFKIEEYELLQLKKYSSLIGGTLLSHGKMYFPEENSTARELDLASMPVIETDEGAKILIISGENVNDALLRTAQDYWKNLKIQLMSDALDSLKKIEKNQPAPKKVNITIEYRKIVETLLHQTGYDYAPEARIPFMVNNINLEAVFGRVIREDTTDLLLNFGNVYGSALETLEKREFEIISITPKLSRLQLINTLFSHLGHTTWENPSFSTGDTVETIKGVYASKNQKKFFIPTETLSRNAIAYLEKENIRILSPVNKITVP